MPIPTYSIYQGESPDNKPHPRLFWRHIDKADYTARKDNTSSWKTLWDSVIIPSANSKKAQSDATIGGSSQVLSNMAILCMTGWLLETGVPGGGYKAKAISAAIYLAGLADGTGPDKRERTLAMAMVFDALFDDLTTAQKNTLASELMTQCDLMSFRTDEYMDGHTGNDQMCQAAAALAVHGWGAFAAQARLDESMDCFYGGPTRGPGEARFEMPRWEKSDGGSEKGGWYTYLGSWCELFMMWFLGKATSLNPWGTGAWPNGEGVWASKVWEFILWQQLGGQFDDREIVGDQDAIDAPKFQWEHRLFLSILAGKYQNAATDKGGQMMWHIHQNVWDTYDSDDAMKQVWDFIFIDRGAVTALDPESASPVPSTKRLFQPPGLFYFRDVKRGSGHNKWSPNNALQFRFEGRRHYDIGHTHLGAGSFAAYFKGEPLVLSPCGIYDAFNSIHHKHWFQRTCGQSFAPYIIDPAAEYKRWSETVDNDGGQHFKKYSNTSTPGNVYKMQNDGPVDLAHGHHVGWLRTAEFSKPLDNADFIFLFEDIKPAYQKDYLLAGPASLVETKWMIIYPTAANTLNWPAVLFYCRIIKNVSSFQTGIPIHMRSTVQSAAYGFTGMTHFGTGKMWMDIRNVGGYSVSINSEGTPPDANGYGPNQFRFRGSGTNRPPNEGANSRKTPGLKRYSIWWEKAAGNVQDDYVALLMFGDAGDSEPVPGRAWVTDGADPNNYAITLGSVTYAISRLSKSAALGGTDTTAPAVPTGLALTPAPISLIANWTDPADQDLSKIIIEARTSAIT